MSTALKLRQIYLDLVFGVPKFKSFPHKAVKGNNSESSKSSELRSTSASIRSADFLLSILYLHCSK